MTPTCLAVAYASDIMLGDPEWFPHPVRCFGLLTGVGERYLRVIARGPKAELCAGAVLTGAVVSVAWSLGRPKSALWQTTLAWTALATRSLLDEAGAVIRAVEEGDIERARARLSRIVGRDTAHLDEAEIARAVIETLAESACDGIVAPLFWLALAGPSGAMAYKAVNTMDSMIGHRESPYLYFGRAAARLDDAANFVPARLTALALAALRPAAWSIWRRDGRLHASPNAGQSEAAMAGALGVRLGGTNRYDGQRHQSPILNPEGRIPSVRDAKAAMCIVAAVSGVAFGIALIVIGWRRRT